MSDAGAAAAAAGPVDPGASGSNVENAAVRSLQALDSSAIRIGNLIARMMLAG